jgi:RNA polymerase sigma-70 factor (ECF subfamily)
MVLPGAGPHDDVRLIRESARGDADSREQLERRLNCIPRLLAARNRALGRPFTTAQLEDLAQETFVRVLSNLGAFRGDARVESWIARVCRFVIADAFRLRERDRRSVELEPDMLGLLIAPCQQERSTLRSAVRTLIAELPREELRIVELHLHGQLSFERIAALLQVTPNAAKARYYRTLSRLRRRLERA